MNKLYNGDCLDIMKDIESNSVDLILCDPPYGTTACKWDEIIPLDAMWRELERVAKLTTPIVLFATQPFTTKLIASNLKMFKYCWVWEKNFSTNFLHAKRQPLRKHEDIIVFYKKPGSYYPIKTKGHAPTQSARGSSVGNLWTGENKRDYAGGDTERFPTSILKFTAVDPKQRVHPTEKPENLLEYLVKTYSNELDTVLDFTMGSGTTGLACKNLNRKFIGIELDETYFNIAKERIQ